MMKKHQGVKSISLTSKSSTVKLIRFLSSKYDFLYNVILNEVLVREKGTSEYHPANLNTLYIEAREAGHKTSVGEINTFLCSDYIPRINPFESYFESSEHLWEEEIHGDYIEKFAQYISVDDPQRFIVQFKKWLVRCVVCALNDDYFNKQALIFVQDDQNSGKTTLTRFLIPEVLRDYQVENISVDKDSLIALCQNFGVIQDELSTLSKTEINAQKTLMSKSYIKVRHPYDRRPKMEPRRASIWGSTNKAEFLVDETGSVRWLCFGVREIDWAYKSDIDINVVWSQAYQLYKSGFKYEMTVHEILDNELANSKYKTTTIEFELIQKFYSPATKDRFDQFYTATDLCENLAIRTDGKLKISPVEIGKALKFLGFTQTQKRWHEEQRFPVKGYYILHNDLTTYYK
jgi:hypothetical protein